jgi:hypothetical protein
VNRLLASLLAVTFLLLLTPGDASTPGGLAMLTAIAAACTIAAVLVCMDRRVTALPHGAHASGAIAEERRLHSALRRVSSPDAPGRPRPRAPGAGSAPA